MGFIPEVATQVASAVVQVVAGTAKELQSRHRRNTFLDRVNQELFMPRGLYAMVMAFKDVVPGQQPRGPLSRLAGTVGKSLFSSERLDINQTVAKYSDPDPDMSRLKKGLRDIRVASGKTYTEVELPEAAALIYPDLDRVVESDLQGKGKGPESQSIKEKFKGAGAWVQDYVDRKAQATYVSPLLHCITNGRSTSTFSAICHCSLVNSKCSTQVPTDTTLGQEPPRFLTSRPVRLSKRLLLAL